MSPYQQQALRELRALGAQADAAAAGGAGAVVLDRLLGEMRRVDCGIRAHLAAELGGSRPSSSRIPAPHWARRLARVA